MAINLSTKEILQAQTKINAMPAGIYEVSDIFGDEWTDIPSPSVYGQQFLGSVIRCRFKRIRHHGRRSNNHQIYLIP